ncbi:MULTISPECIES: ATP-dependent helicase [unclassified Rhizobium]|uniref:UvrD-helicase domain-containing protein n=1 Tax=unclassified Rhizobium TaxID=2613769 RepID=UPI00160F90E0|nr:MULTISPECIES: ATP-dependent helicase [unclassified Rhizobium]MBB3386652.1 superfamily I DNA/RNA helicase [Rhizobium sp. BK098]MBB3618356.1 superfamily I DNA/RNA helicase [Rhizobium sp. BK609]MBB3684013.1 superfamily I DNA/RNA helicase [Rhizobium sp. BK612]
MTFVWQTDDLNAEQVDAITTQGSVFLSACPGSGKTRALTYKAALELSRLSNENQRVVAITYTHRAADEIRERIETLGVSTDQLWIGTIHSFCLEWILRPYQIYHPALRHGFTVVDAKESEDRLALHCNAARNNVKPFHCAYNYTTEGCELRGISTSFKPAVMKVLEAYWMDLEEHRQVDFEMILRFTYELISRVSTITTLLSKLFRFILVDEYQDTKEIQYGILAKIMRASRGGTQAFVVGDANQAIYGSLGGYAISREDFERACQVSFTPKSLELNYRSSSRIISYFSNFQVSPATIRAEGENRNFPSVVSFNASLDRNALEDELIRLVRHSIESAGVLPKDICIVAPQWIPLAAMTRRLVAAMPQYDFDGPGIAPFARNIDNFFYKLARLALTEPSPFLYVRRSRWAGEILGELDHSGAHAQQQTRASFLRLCNSIQIKVDDGLEYLKLFFDQLFYDLGLELDHYPGLKAHADTFFRDSKDRVEKLEAEGIKGISSVTHFRRVFAGRAGITVSTIHNVKGAEFDVVIAFALLQGMVPNFAAIDDESAKKLLYVIGSRARKHLHLISECGRQTRRGEAYEATKVLAACTFDYDLLFARDAGDGGTLQNTTYVPVKSFEV